MPSTACAWWHIISRADIVLITLCRAAASLWSAITPMIPECGVFVMLGREIAESLGPAACLVPFGLKLLVDAGSIHWDKALTGLRMMAMAGSHHATRTADTVFGTRANAPVLTTDREAQPVAPGLPGARFLLTSDGPRSLRSTKWTVGRKNAPGSR